MKQFIKQLIKKIQMETLPIKKADAIKAFDNADSKGKILLSDLFGEKIFSKKITDRVKTFEDACMVLGIAPNSIGLCGDTDDEIAYKKLKVIVSALNEGWKPDWNNSSEYKYWPYFNMSGFGLSGTTYVNWFTSTTVGSRLCFKSRELAEYAGKQFNAEYKAYLS